MNIIKTSGTFVLYGYIIRYEQMFVNGFERKKQTFVRFSQNEKSRIVAGINNPGKECENDCKNALLCYTEIKKT